MSELFIEEVRKRFTANKYTETYIRLIVSRMGREIDPETYYEKHHIIPRCMNWSDEPFNMVSLTAREHFVAHWLLTKMCKTKSHKSKMVFAFGRFFQQSYERRFSSHDFDKIRNAWHDTEHPRKGSTMPEERKNQMRIENAGEGNPFWGKKHTEAAKKKMKAGAKRRLKDDPDHVNRASEAAAKKKRGVPHTEEHRARLSEAAKRRKRVPCSICDKLIPVNVLKQHENSHKL